MLSSQQGLTENISFMQLMQEGEPPAQTELSCEVYMNGPIEIHHDFYSELTPENLSALEQPYDQHQQDKGHQDKEHQQVLADNNENANPNVCTQELQLNQPEKEQTRIIDLLCLPPMEVSVRRAPLAKHLWTTQTV